MSGVANSFVAKKKIRTRGDVFHPGDKKRIRKGKPLTPYQQRRLVQLERAEKLNRQQRSELVQLRKALLPHQRELLDQLESGELRMLPFDPLVGKSP